MSNAKEVNRPAVETIRQRLVESGFQETLDGKKRTEPPTEKLLDGEQEAKIIATRLGPPPKGYAWRREEVVATEIPIHILLSQEYYSAALLHDAHLSLQPQPLDQFLQVGLAHARYQLLPVDAMHGQDVVFVK